MKRLTHDGLFCDIAKCNETPGGTFCEKGSCSQRKVWERLKEYEDTGMEPCDHAAAKHALDQAEMARKELMEMISIIGGVELDRLKELVKADKEDHLEVLPCKIGGTVWTNIAVQGDRYRKSDRPYPVKVCYIGMGNTGYFFHVVYSNGRNFPFNFDEIGKTVFLTREEAERALKGGQNNAVT